MKTQSEAIADYLRLGHTLTPLEALNLFGCLRLGARVWDLKREGLPIECEMVETPSGKRVAQYRLRVDVRADSQWSAALPEGAAVHPVL